MRASWFLLPLLLATPHGIGGCRRNDPPPSTAQQPPYPPPYQPPATTQAAAAFPWLLPPRAQLPPTPSGWAIPNFPLPLPPGFQLPAGFPFPTTGSQTTPTSPPAGNLPPPSGNASFPNARGRELAERINAYRASRGLPTIPLSRSLGIVAATHVQDQETNRPEHGSCNQHSWTPTTQWTGCCYTSDHAQANCMWRKPSEITGWRTNGYEISVRTTGTITPEQAVESWKSSPEHHAIMINGANWAKRPWRAIGAACGSTYAVAWFAEETDPAGGY